MSLAEGMEYLFFLSLVSSIFGTHRVPNLSDISFHQAETENSFLEDPGTFVPSKRRFRTPYWRSSPSRLRPLCQWWQTCQTGFRWSVSFDKGLVTQIEHRECWIDFTQPEFERTVTVLQVETYFLSDRVKQSFQPKYTVTLQFRVTELSRSVHRLSSSTWKLPPRLSARLPSMSQLTQSTIEESVSFETLIWWYYIILFVHRSIIILFPHPRHLLNALAGGKFAPGYKILLNCVSMDLLVRGDVSHGQGG